MGLVVRRSSLAADLLNSCNPFKRSPRRRRKTLISSLRPSTNDEPATGAAATIYKPTCADDHFTRVCVDHASGTLYVLYKAYDRVEIITLEGKRSQLKLNMQDAPPMQFIADIKYHNNALYMSEYQGALIYIVDLDTGRVAKAPWLDMYDFRSLCGLDITSDGRIFVAEPKKLLVLDPEGFELQEIELDCTEMCITVYEDNDNGADNNDKTVAYVTDDEGRSVRRIDVPESKMDVLAGNPKTKGDNNGPASKARFTLAAWVVRDFHGTIYVSEQRMIRMLSSDNRKECRVSDFVGGNTSEALTVDGRGAEAKFTFIKSLVLDTPTDAMYLIDDDGSLRRVLIPVSHHRAAMREGLSSVSGLIVDVMELIVAFCYRGDCSCASRKMKSTSSRECRTCQQSLLTWPEKAEPVEQRQKEILRKQRISV